MLTLSPGWEKWEERDYVFLWHFLKSEKPFQWCLSRPPFKNHWPKFSHMPVFQPISVKGIGLSWDHTGLTLELVSRAHFWRTWPHGAGWITEQNWSSTMKENGRNGSCVEQQYLLLFHFQIWSFAYVPWEKLCCLASGSWPDTITGPWCYYKLAGHPQWSYGVFL